MKKIPRRSDIPSQHEGSDGADALDDVRINEDLDEAPLDEVMLSDPRDAESGDTEKGDKDKNAPHADGSADVTQKYLNEIGARSLLTAEEELEIGRAHV